MKYIKSYESLLNNYGVGDYIIVTTDEYDLIDEILII